MSTPMIDPFNDSAILVGGQVIFHIHPPERCAGQACAVHNPSDHQMASWPQCYRTDLRMIERLCPHGIGHPDPDDPRSMQVHGCDGCCS